MLNLSHKNRLYARPLSKSFYSCIATANYAEWYCNQPKLLISNILKLSSVYHIPVILDKIIKEISKSKNVFLPSCITPPITIDTYIDLPKIGEAERMYFFYNGFQLKLQKIIICGDGIINENIIIFTITAKTDCTFSNIHTIPQTILNLCK